MSRGGIKRRTVKKIYKNPGVTETKLNQYLSSQLIGVFWANSKYSGKLYDTVNKTAMDNFKILRELVEGC